MTMKKEEFTMTHLVSTLQERLQPSFLVLLGVVMLIALVTLSQTAFASQGQEKAEVSPWSLINEQGTRDEGQMTKDQTAFTYQGQLKDASGPVNGAYDLQFILYSAQTGGEPLGSIDIENLALTNGLFNVRLDFGRAVLEAKEGWLEIGVRPGGSAEPYTVLFPRQKLTPTPYAIFAQHEQWSLIGVPVGFKDGGGKDTVITAVTDANDVGEQNVKGSDSQKDHLPSIGGSHVALAPNGTANYLAKFDAAGNPTANSLLYDTGAGVGIGTTNPQAGLEINRFPSLRLRDPFTPNSLFEIRANGNALEILPLGGIVFFGGKVGIETRDPAGSLHVRGFSPVRILGDTFTLSGAESVDFFARSSIFSSDLGGIRIQRQAQTGDIDTLIFAARSGSSASEVMRVKGNGNVGIGHPAPIDKLTVFTSGNQNGIYGRTSSAPGFNGVFGENGGGGYGVFGKSETGIGVGGETRSADGYGGYFINRGGGVALWVDGRARAKVLEITGGGDLAEPFKITNTEAIRPGLVVAIDPDQPGRLRIAGKAYDRTVAGIISGANGINPGLTMKQEGTVADGAHPVALTGRVYCWADAANGPIEPGDLLTTSATPGHAMKVKNHKKAQGAIIGKAMTGLERGKGLVLVLVTLQ
jgi:hypothetical protein